MLLRLFAAAMLLIANLTPAGPAQAACTAAAGGGFSSASQIVDNQVLVCAKSGSSTVSAKSTTSTSTKSTTTKAIAPAKPACPTSVSTTAEIVSAVLLGCKVPGPSQPPAVSLVIKPKVTTVLVVQPNSQTDQAAFSPDAVAISASKVSMSVGESSILNTNALTHERSASILGRIGYVRFVPMGYTWQSDSSWSATGAVAIASFDTVASHKIGVVVHYAASYRFSLAEAWIQTGTVTASANTTLQITEPAAPAPISKLVGHLVWANCVVHVSSYRC